MRGTAVLAAAENPCEPIGLAQLAREELALPGDTERLALDPRDLV